MTGVGRCLQFMFLVGVLLLVSSVHVGAKANLPAGTLTTTELKSLVFGKTAEVVFLKSNKGLRYFSPNGELRQVKNSRRQKGHWKVNKQNRLCTKFGDSAWSCRVLLPKGPGYRQYIVKKSGKHEHELTYKRFHPGRKLTELAHAPILPTGTLNKKQLVALFSDQTVETVTAKNGRASLSYYGPSGSVEQLREGIKRRGKWRVNKADRICLQMQNLKEKCRIVVKQANSYKKYIVKKNGQHQHSVTYRTFTAGNHL